jgi:hypothetical protein
MTRAARVLLVLLVVAGLAAAAWLFLRERLAPPAAEPELADSTTAQTGLRAATLWFADDSGDSLVSEVRELPEQEGVHERVVQLVDALVRGPERRGVGLMPEGTSVLHAYLDDRGLLTLDLSRAFQQGFHGGSRAEDLVTGSLLRTIGSNLPEVKQVLVVCGGAPIVSLGGHLPLDQPIDPQSLP